MGFKRFEEFLSRFYNDYPKGSVRHLYRHHVYVETNDTKLWFEVLNTTADALTFNSLPVGTYTAGGFYVDSGKFYIINSIEKVINSGIQHVIKGTGYCYTDQLYTNYLTLGTYTTFTDTVTQIF